MAVYQHTYHGYEGPRTPQWSRFGVVWRHAQRSLFKSKLLLGFFVACYLLPLFFLITIYVVNRPAFMGAAGIHFPFQITRVFFYDFLHWQCFVAFIFTAFAAPGLISPDLANGGLVLYLARPLSRAEYFLGKFGLLALLISALTWAPGLVLFAVECDLGGAAWRADNLWIGGGIFLAGMIWVVVLSLLALALSAWIKWRVVAGAALLGVYFFGAGFGGAINFTLATSYGSLLDFMGLHLTVWSDLFRLAPPNQALETWSWVTLAAIATISLGLILRKLRPLEVVK